jgi:hypothetical protein
MLHFGDLDDLIAAVRALAPNPIMELLVPTVVGLVGVASGFGLSSWKESAGRKRAKNEARQTALAESRRPAVNELVRYIEWAISSFQQPGMRQKVGQGIDHVVALFADTGAPEDLTIGRDVRKFLSAFTSALLSSGRANGMGSWFEWTDADEAKMHELSTQIAEDGRQWIDDALTTSSFSRKLAVRTIMLPTYALAASP